MKRRRLGVVYDFGAASVRDIAASLVDVYELVFIVPRGRDLITRTLSSLGEVVAIDDCGGVAETSVVLRKHVGVQGIVTFSERMLRAAADITAEMGLIGHDPNTAMRLTDKRLQRHALKAADIPVPRTALVSSVSDWREAIASVGLPAVTKPVHGEGSRWTYPITGAEDVVRMENSLVLPASNDVDDAGYIVEEMFIGRDSWPFGDYVSVECATVSSQTILRGITSTFPLTTPFREAGKFWPCYLSAKEQNEILSLTKAALAALGVQNGVTHTEIKLTESGPRIIEVNGRLGGFIADLAKRHSGINLVRDAAEIALGGTVEDRQNEYMERPGVTYSYMNIPPVSAQVLVRMTGHRKLRRTAGFEGYSRLQADGSKLAVDGSSDFLDVLRGHAPSRIKMLEQLRNDLSELTFTFDSDCEPPINALNLPGARFLR